eukprot:COSAG06_NODE_657_length_13324_cov_11.730380_9_plen_264_part_00
MPDLHVPEEGGGGNMHAAAANEDQQHQQEIDALAQRAMDDAAASGGGGLGKLIGGFLVCYVCCGLSCFGGAVALVVLGVNRLVDDGADITSGSAAVDPDNGVLLLVLGIVPIIALVICVTYLRVQDAGWCRPDYVSPNGLAAKRKEDMLRRAGMHDMDEDEERELSLAAGPVSGGNSPPAVAPATMRITSTPPGDGAATPFGIQPWKGMNSLQQTAAGMLGWNSQSWDDEDETPFQMVWAEMTDELCSAAYALNFDETNFKSK